jgi:hypothetical protein
MAGTSIGRAILDVLGDFTGVQKQGEQVAQTIGQSFSRHIGAGLKIAAGGFSGYAVKQFADQALEIAESTELGVKRTDAVFGKYAASIDDWAKHTAASLGIPRDKALELADSVGLRLTQSLGYTQQAAAAAAPQIVTLAENMALFNRIPFDQAFNAIEKGMLGQTKGLKSVGVNIDAVAVKHKALELGLLKGTADSSKALEAEGRAHDVVTKAANTLATSQDKAAAALKAHGAGSAQYRAAARGVENSQLALAQANVKYKDAQDKANAAADGVGGVLDANAKAQATYALILDQTKVQQGQAARSADDYGQAQKRTGAQIEDLKGKFGAGILPAMAGQQVFIADKLLPTVTALSDKLLSFPVGATIANDALTGVTFTSEHATTIVSLLSIGTTAWTGAAKLGGAAAKTLGPAIKGVGESMSSASGLLRGGAKDAGQLELALGSEKGVAGTAGKFGGVFGKMGGAFTALKAPFLATIAQSWAFTASLLANPIVLIIIGLVLLAGVFVLLYIKCKPFHDFVNALWASIKVLAGVVWGFLQSLPQMFANALNWVLAFVRDHWQLIVILLLGPIGLIIVAVQKFGPTVYGFIRDALQRIVDLASGIGEKIVHGLQSGIGGAWSAFVKFFEGKVNLLPDGIRKILGIASPSSVFAGIGRSVVDGVTSGIAERRDALLSKVSGLSSDVQAAFTPTLAVAVAGAPLSATPSVPTSTQAAALGGGLNLVQNISSPQADPDTIAKAMGWELSRRGLTAR